MERKYIRLPLPSVAVREFSLISAVLYFFAKSIFTNIPHVLSLLIFLSTYIILRTIIADNKYSTCYKVVISSVLIIVLALAMYGIFFSMQFEHINHLITIIGLCIACGSVLIIGLIISILKKRINTAQKGEDVAQRFFDITHILMFYVVVLTNL